MLNIRDLGLDIGTKSLFHNVNNVLLANKRYGVVGPNGAGKSTFLKLLAGQETPSAGTIEKANNITIGILKQDHFLYENNRVVDAVIQGNDPLWSALLEKERLLQKLDLTDDEGCHLGTLEEIIQHHDGYNAEVRAQRVLIGLGIPEKYHFGPLSALSGGYKLRVLLSQVLFQNPDIMLLDEPTNHLDIISIDWLENFLKKDFKGLLVFVSHDRDFLNHLSTHILDIDYSTITQYTGNYDRFQDEKLEILAQKHHELKHKEKQIETMQTFVNRFGASATKSSQAQSRLKMIKRIELELPDIVASSARKPYFNFIPEKQSGKSILNTTHIHKNFDERILLKNITFNLHRNEKCAIIGANGIGKSTLLKILLNLLTPDSGGYEWNETVKIAYFPQDYKNHLPPNLTVWEWLEQQVKATHQEARSVLGQVLFKGKDVDKKISVLSGGESARLVLARMILEKANVLIFDEPTNHLDLESVDALVDSLTKYTGTVLFVSHNRYFIDHVATRVLALSENGGATNYLGNYHDYLAQYGADYLNT